MMFGRLVLLCFATASLLSAQAWKGEIGDMESIWAKAKKGDPAAMAEIAFCSFYCMGGVYYDEELIYQYASKSAAAGNAWGMETLASCYAAGIGVDVDHEKIFEWAKKSADLGHPAGIRRLGCCYQFGNGVDRDRSKAIEFYKKSEAAGYIIARWSVAMNMEYSESVATNMEYSELDPGVHDAIYQKFRDLATEHDHFYSYESMYNMILNLKRDDWRQQDIMEIFDAFQRHSDRGKPRAGYLHISGMKDMLGDDEYVHWLIEEARNGNSGPVMGLARLIDDTKTTGFEFPIRAGHGVMFSLYRLSYENGNLWSNCNYINGAVFAYRSPPKNMKKDFDASRKLALKFLEKGHAHYHDDLWKLYVRGVREGGKYAIPELAIAHATYHSQYNGEGSENLEFVYGGRAKGFKVDLPKAYAAALAAIEAKHRVPSMTKRLRQLESKMTPTQIADANALRKAGFPQKGEQQAKAQEVLRAHGVPLKGNYYHTRYRYLTAH